MDELIRHLTPHAAILDIFNSIANFIYLDGKTDKSLMKDKTPQMYISKLCKTKSSDNISEYCKENLLDYKHLKTIDKEDKVKVFIQARAKMLPSE